MPARTRITGWVGGDTLDCIAWTLRDEARVSCNGPINQHGMFTFGAWRDSRDSGYYRLLRADEDKWGFKSRAAVQWLAFPPSRTSVATSVRSQVELPTGEAVQGATYAIRDGRVVARVESVRPTKWGNRRWLEFELGGPGEMRPLPDH